MKNPIKLIGLLSFCIMLGACTTLLHAGNDRESGSLDKSQDVLDQVTRIHALSGQQLAKEADALQKAYAIRRTERSRLRLALFLAIAPAPQGDRSRALALLDVPPGDINGKGRQHPLALILMPLLQDYHRLAESKMVLQQKQRELQQSNDQLQQKLDALRDIETQIQEHPTIK